MGLFDLFKKKHNVDQTKETTKSNKFDKKEILAKSIVDGANFQVDYDDAKDFSELLLNYTVVGKEETINSFYEFVKRFFKRYGVYAQCIVNVSYFMGLLNSSEIISDEELEAMNTDFMDTIRKTIEKM